MNVTERDSIIDIDGHIVEPPDMWQRYVDRRWRDNAIRVVRAGDGIQRWLIRGRPSSVFPALTPLNPGEYRRIDRLPEAERGREWLRLLQQDYAKASAAGACDPGERVKVLDRQGVEATLLFPTLGLSWEEDALDDADYTYAHMRAYNTWIAEFCATAPKRLLGVAQVSLLDAAAAVAEIERVARLGAKAVVMRPVAVAARPPSHRDFSSVWAALEANDLRVGLHVLAPQRTLLNWGRVTRQSIFAKVHDTLPQILGLTDLILGGVLSRHPRLHLACLEIGAFWVPWMLGAMDEKASEPVTARFLGDLKPSELFHRQCWVTPAPREDLDLLMLRFGCARKVMAYSDYPHPEVLADMLGWWREQSGKLEDKDRERFLRGNALEFLGLSQTHG